MPRPALAALSLLLAACAVPERPGGTADPYEAVNRRVHAANVAADRGLVRPVAMAYGRATPRPLRRGIANLADTLGTPRYIVNDVLQGNVGDAGHNFVRLAMNLVFGLGLLDVASGAGVEKRPSDFGETLYRWGAREGAYLALPALGPSTERDLAGIIVDVALNPLSALSAGDRERALSAATGAGVLTLLDTRHESRGIIDALLHDSADSYAQTRDAYLQNRRFQLSGGEGDDLQFDPYGDLDGQ